MDDVMARVALKRAVADSAEIEVQLEATRGCRPLLAVLLRARAAAAAAMCSLTTAAPDDAQEIRRLQNEVTRFREMVEWLSAIVAEGFEAEAELSDEEREEMIEDIAGTPEGQQEARDLGLTPQE